MTLRAVPFFRPSITQAEIDEVVAVLQSGWLTTGSRAQRFERDFAAAVNATAAVAVNSCTAALHLAIEALGLERGQVVVVPTMTFAATANVVRHMGAVPLLVDCLPGTLHLDLDAAERAMADLRAGRLGIAADATVAGVIPVHVGGLMLDMSAVDRFAERHRLWVVEDAAHAFPAAWRPEAQLAWQQCGENTSAVTCFSFYANKTITTGEGGMAVTSRSDLADRMRQMSLHGLSHTAWKRYEANGSWDYAIEAAGYKYNLTDVAAAIGIHQLARAEDLRRRREAIATMYFDRLGAIDEIELPPAPADRVHAWHLFPIRLRLDRLEIGRNQFIDELKAGGIGTSVHWRPLHLHPCYAGDRPATARDRWPVATDAFARSLSLPLFPSMTEADVEAVVAEVTAAVRRHSRIALAV